MQTVKWSELAKALFLAGVFGYLTIALVGLLWVGFLAFAGFGWLFYDLNRKIAATRKIFSYEFRREFGGLMEKTLSFLGSTKAFYWDKNEARVTTVLLFIFSQLFLFKILREPTDPRGSFVEDCIVYFAFLLVVVQLVSLFALMGRADTVKPNLSDKKVAKAIILSPYYFFAILLLAVTEILY